MAAYYNEFKPEAAHMLRQLIADDLIAPGDVDERNIVDVQPDDIRGYAQCHFFAGIGGWSVALRLAGWSDDRPVWTGSCPCQPFSTAGKRKGQSDERHLWPIWFRLIRECRPAIIFGEQVAAAIAHGWWDDVADDMERENYACAAAVLPACSVGKPHKRDRLWFMGNAESARTGDDGYASEHVADAENTRSPCGGQRQIFAEPCEIGGELVANTENHWAGKTGIADSQKINGGCDESQFNGGGTCGIMANAIGERGCGGDGEWENAENVDASGEGSGELTFLACPDGKSRPVKRGICLLAYGVQHRAPILHAFGNAIVPEVAATFIEAAEENIG